MWCTVKLLLWLKLRSSVVNGRSNSCVFFSSGLSNKLVGGGGNRLELCVVISCMILFKVGDCRMTLLLLSLDKECKRWPFSPLEIQKDENFFKTKSQFYVLVFYVVFFIFLYDLNFS